MRIWPLEIYALHTQPGSHDNPWICQYPERPPKPGDGIDPRCPKCLMVLEALLHQPDSGCVETPERRSLEETVSLMRAWQKENL